MTIPVLATKLYAPPPRRDAVLRTHLIKQLNEALNCQLTLVSAPAGFGKTTLVSEWISCFRKDPQTEEFHPPVAWLSLDAGDNDPVRFFTYFISALQTIQPEVGTEVLNAIQSPQLPSFELLLTNLLNEVVAVKDDFILVLDDYHVIDSKLVNEALNFMLTHQPLRMHLVIITREDPSLPLSRLRGKGQLTELRASDLRFTPAEATDFLNQVMGLALSEEDTTALDIRTEGWIVGLQFAALSMQQQQDTASFIKSFTGSNRFVLDYLMEEVLQKQPKDIQTFLLQTSILDRMCASLCDAVMGSHSGSSQVTLEYLDRTNLFIVPLDSEQRWYRYHHLFADLLRQRLQRSVVSSAKVDGKKVTELHNRAFKWYEAHGLDMEAFQHAAAAGEVDQAVRLIDGKGISLYHRGALVHILKWLESLPKPELDKRPALWLMYARVFTSSGQTSGVEEKLQAAENALQGAELNVENRDLIGFIASNRATLAYTRYQPESAIVQAQRALAYLSPDNLSTRSITTFTLGVGFMQKGDRAAAIQAFKDAISISQKTSHIFVTSMATMALGNMQIMENLLYTAFETHQQALQLFGTQPLPIACEAHLGLAQISYEWNNLTTTDQHGEQALQLARQFDRVIDRYVICELFLARLKLAQGDIAGASAMLAETEQSVRQNNFVQRIPEVAAAKVLVLLRQGDLSKAAHLVKLHDLPFSLARVHLAQGDPYAALEVLEPLRLQMEAKGWMDEHLKVLVLQSVALRAHEDEDKAIQLLGEALKIAEPGGFIRLFIDEGEVMAQLLHVAASHGVMPHYIDKLLTAFEPENQKSEDNTGQFFAQPFYDPLSLREVEVLRLIAQGFSNREIAEKLFLALDTIKGHNRKIFEKLQVQSRTEAVARSRELGLL